jgi:hypothetical protein
MSSGGHGFFGGAEDFTGTAFGAAAFLGFFFSLVCEWLPLPILITSCQGKSGIHCEHILTHGGEGSETLWSSG